MNAIILGIAYNRSAVVDGLMVLADIVIDSGAVVFALVVVGLILLFRR